jgi:hypothetical protein
MKILPSQKLITGASLLWRLGCGKCLDLQDDIRFPRENSDTGLLSADSPARFCRAAMRSADDYFGFGTIFA